MSNHPNSISGLTDEEAQEFHHYWIQGTVGFTAVAVLAHILSMQPLMPGIFASICAEDVGALKGGEQ